MESAFHMSAHVSDQRLFFGYISEFYCTVLVQCVSDSAIGGGGRGDA